MGYWVGGAVVVVGSLVAILWFFLLVLGEPDPATYPHVPVPGDRQVDLTSQSYTLFDEYPTDGRPDRTPVVRITGPNGEEPLAPLPEEDASLQTYTIGTKTSGAGFATIRPSVAGTYRVEVLSDPVGGAATGTEQIAIGESLYSSDSYLGAIGLGALTFLVGLGVVVLTAVRRRIWRRSAASNEGEMPDSRPRVEP